MLEKKNQVPEEICDLEPQRTCKHVTTLVPKLQPSEECVDVPKEVSGVPTPFCHLNDENFSPLSLQVCSRSKVNPRKVAKPVVKKWCYTPTLESGLL